MKYTKYQYSRNLAWEILLRERVRQLPVEIIPICKRMGIRVLRYSDMPSLHFNAGGASAEIGGKMYIFYDDTAPEERQRFQVGRHFKRLQTISAYPLTTSSARPSKKKSPPKMAG